jgi:hypothetical protein
LASTKVRMLSCLLFSTSCSCMLCDWVPMTTVLDLESILALRRAFRMRLVIHFSAA